MEVCWASTFIVEISRWEKAGFGSHTDKHVTMKHGHWRWRKVTAWTGQANRHVVDSEAETLEQSTWHSSLWHETSWDTFPCGGEVLMDLLRKGPCSGVQESLDSHGQCQLKGI